MIDVSGTVAPKSDQLNFDDLIAGSITIRVTNVSLSDSPDQPVVIHYEGENKRPYKPCKSMRRVLIAAWGSNGRDWIGRSITLFGDPSVQFGGKAVGGIRISHLSHIDRDLNIMITTTRSKRLPYSIKKLAVQVSPCSDEDFQKDLPRMTAAIESGKSSALDIANYFKGEKPLTEQQIATLEKIAQEAATKAV